MSEVAVFLLKAWQKKSYLLLIAVNSIFSCKPPKNYISVIHDPLLYCTTVKRLNDIVLENNFPPVVASRNYVYANVAAYEVIAAGYDSAYQSLAGQLNGLETMPRWEGGEIDYPLASMIAFVIVGNAVTFPEGSMMAYRDQLLKIAADAGMSNLCIVNSTKYADTVSARIISWAKKDHYLQTRSAEKYTVDEEEGRWIPTPPMYAPGMEAHWMDIRPMVLDSSSECKPPPPPAFNLKDTNGVYFKDLMIVKRTVDNLTDSQRHVADFWDDNPFNMIVSGHVMFATKKFSPPGHWMNITGIAAYKSKADFATTVYAYTETSIALFDAFISCWAEKYRSNFIRPETVINKAYDQDWRPYIQTPPFPSYTSGHSVISAAAAEVMTKIYGDNFSYVDTSSIEFGIPARSFTSFRSAALEAGNSRLYGGIHYPFDLTQGNLQGIKVGNMVISRLKMKK
ncbi:MAG: vanadium-dependent haloperoxidase [Chitinophagaceae bacterium]